jgi:hypothetical protein
MSPVEHNITYLSNTHLLSLGLQNDNRYFQNCPYSIVEIGSVERKIGLDSLQLFTTNYKKGHLIQNIKESSSGPSWIRTSDQSVMSRLL